jgi:hypothetical protein
MMWFGPTAFDGTGRGNVGGEWDGWALCNGQNGTPDLTKNFFIVTGDWNYGGTGGYSVWDTVNGQWQTQGGNQLGEMIASNQLPQMFVRTGAFGAQGAPTGYNLSDGSDGQGTAGFATATVRDVNMNPIGAGGQKALPLPHYIGLGFVMFVGYQ